MAIIELVDRDVTAKGKDSGQVVTVEAEESVQKEAPKAKKTKAKKEAETAE